MDASEEFKATDWREIADEADLTKDEAKKLIKVYGEFVDVMEPVQVTEGYELQLSDSITGELLEKPQQSMRTVIVLKLNGRWVWLDVLDYLEGFFEMIG